MTESSKPGPADVAVLLVAGIGERLHPLTLHRPKALVDVGPESLLGRSVRLLIAHGVKEIVLATGFKDSAVRESMKDIGVPVHYCPNLDYRTTQNAVSLLACDEAVAGRSFYKLDGDLLFSPEVLTRLDGAEGDLRVAVDRTAKLGEEEMKVRLRPDGRLIEAFGKKLDAATCHGESIGIERVSDVVVSLIFHGLAVAYRSGQTHLYYEDVYGRLIGEGLSAGAVDVSDLPWAEIDTAEDLDAARKMIESGTLS